MEVKRELARIIIGEFHDADAAQRADAEFRKIFSNRQVPTDIEEKELASSAEAQLLTKVITAAGLAPTNNEARRLLQQGGVSVDDVRIDDPRATLEAAAGKSYQIKVGKRRFARVKFV